MTQPIQVNWQDLKVALELDADMTRAYLDLETGDLVFIAADEDDPTHWLNLYDPTGTASQTAIHTRINADLPPRKAVRVAVMVASAQGDDRYLPVPPVERREFPVMQDFIHTIEDLMLYEAFEAVTREPRPIRRFLQLIGQYPELERAYWAFRDETHRDEALAWLEAEGVAVTWV